VSQRWNVVPNTNLESIASYIPHVEDTIWREFRR